MKLSELDPKSYSVEESETPLKLSDLKSSQYTFETSPEEEKSTSTLEAALGGLGQGTTFGFGDELAGAFGATIDPLLYGDEGKSWKERYQENRDYARRQNDLAQQEHPTAYIGGEIGGSIATSVIPVAAAGKVGVIGKTLSKAPLLADINNLGTAGRIGRGAVEGASYGLGGSEADLTEGQVGQALKDTGTGALWGGGLSAGGELVGEGINKIRSGAKSVERQQALKEIGMLKGEGKKIAESKGLKYQQEELPDALLKPQTLNTYEDRMKDFSKAGDLTKQLGKGLDFDQAVAVSAGTAEKPVIRFFSNAGEELERVQSLKEKALENMKSISAKIDGVNGSTFNPMELAERIDAKIGNVYRDEPLYRSLSKQYEDALETIINKGDKNISFADAQKLKDLLTGYAYKEGAEVQGKQLVREMIHELNDYWHESLVKSVQGTISNAGSGLEGALSKFNSTVLSQETLKDFLKAKKMYGMMKDAERSLNDKIVKEGSNLSPDFMRSLAYYGTIGAGAGAILGGGDLSSGGIGAAALPLLRAYGTKYGAQTMIKAAQGVQRVASGAQGLNKAVVSGAKQQLATPDKSQSYESMKSDPKYGQLLQDPKRAPLNHYLLMQRDEEYRKRILGGQK